MAEDIILNFGGDASEPVQTTGGRFDRVPPGLYYVKPKLEAATTLTDKPSASGTIHIIRGPMKGKKVRDNFVLPRPGTDDSPFGQRRLHGLVVATGIKPLSGKKVALSKILAALAERECLAQIADGEMPASGNYAARPVSEVVGYWNPKSKEGMKLLKEAGGDTDEEEALDEEEEESGEGDDETGEESADEDAEGEVEEAEPAPKKKRGDSAAGKSAEKPKAKKDDDEDGSVEGLFDDDD